MHERRLVCLFVLCLLAACGGGPAPEQAAAPPTASGDYFAYVGDYTTGTSKGIYVSSFNHDSGALGEPALAAEIENPSYLTLHPNKQFLYAVTENSGEGSVSAFSIERPGGKLTLLNTKPTKGGLPCDLEVDKTGQMLTVVNYESGSVISYPVNADGSLGDSTDFIQHEGSSVNKDRQQGPHAHSIDFSADNRFAIVSDLGLDKVFIYNVDTAAAKLEPHDPPFVSVKPGNGPRHFAFHPTKPYAYSTAEMGSVVAAFNWDAADGKLTEIETVSTLPEGFDGQSSTAEIEVHPSGNFLYVSNRGHNSIAVFSIDLSTGRLTLVQNAPTLGEIPRNFAIAPGGEFLLADNQNSGNVVVFKIDQDTGKLTPTGTQIAVDKPVCIKFTPVNVN